MARLNEPTNDLKTLSEFHIVWLMRMAVSSSSSFFSTIFCCIFLIANRVLYSFCRSDCWRVKRNSHFCLLLNRTTADKTSANNYLLLCMRRWRRKRCCSVFIFCSIQNSYSTHCFVSSVSVSVCPLIFFFFLFLLRSGLFGSIVVVVVVRSLSIDGTFAFTNKKWHHFSFASVFQLAFTIARTKRSDDGRHTRAWIVRCKLMRRRRVVLSFMSPFVV